MTEEENSEETKPDKGIAETETVPEMIPEDTPLQPENSSQPNESKSEVNDMEVHHHPNVEKKNFKEYVLEFVMIFIALVFSTTNLSRNEFVFYY